MDSVLSPGQDEERSGGPEPMATSARAQSQTEAVPTDLRHCPLSDERGGERTVGLDAGPVGQRMVAAGRHPPSPPGDEPELVQGQRLDGPRSRLSCFAKCLPLVLARLSFCAVCIGVQKLVQAAIIRTLT